jgi:succinate dehydrogenase/fumarate reductase flavoprotein subunit
MSTLERTADEIVITDVLIVGSEGAGARAALEASKRCKSVVVATKGVVGKGGATLTADADIDIDSRSAALLFGLPGDMNDSPEKFAEDMCKEGEYLNNQRLVEIHCEEAPERVKELVDWGARIDKLTHAPGHTYPRGVWIPGTEFARVLTKELKKRNNIRLLEHMMITDLLTNNGAVVGATGIEITTGKFFVIKAKAVILCTGGAMRIYPHTTAPDELTGDGLAAAFRVGAELIDMEFPMFLPYTLIGPASLDGVDFSYLLSAYVQVQALNRHGERYMAKWDPERLEHSTRDVNSIAAMVEVLDGRGSPNGGTFLSLKHLPDNLIDFTAEWFPSNIANFRYGGFNMRDYLPDLHTQALETAPASHFWNGGVNINEFCETNVPGLFACGEGTGSIHGANRVSGNALTMTQVWGPRAGIRAAEYVASTNSANIDLDQVTSIKERLLAPIARKDGVDPIALRKRVQDVAWNYVGVVREEKGLMKGIEEIGKMRAEAANLFVTNKARRFNHEWVESMQVSNMLDVMEMVASASLVRKESRGALYRRDFPKTDNINWVKNITVRNLNGEIVTSVSDVKLDKYQPAREIREYGSKE